MLWVSTYARTIARGRPAVMVADLATIVPEGRPSGHAGLQPERVQRAGAPRARSCTPRLERRAGFELFQDRGQRGLGGLLALGDELGAVAEAQPADVGDRDAEEERRRAQLLAHELG